MEQEIQRCIAVLKKGGTILYPTDTIWGIGCDATNAEAVEKVYQLKNRPGEKAMIVLVADEKDILKHVAAPDLQIFDYLGKTKKPTTVIYDGAIGLAENLSGMDGSIAIRICHEPFCRHLIKRFRKPIVSTSANFSGKQGAATFGEIIEEIKTGVDYIVMYRRHDFAAASPSSVIKWNKNGSVTIIRP